MDLLGGVRSAGGGQAPRPPTIVLDVPLTGETVNIDFMQLAEQKYGWAAVHPVEARWKAANGADSDDESESDQPQSGAEHAPNGNTAAAAAAGVAERSKKRRRRNDMEYYDVEDPFIDDDELKLQETAAAAKDGFFVWHGPLVPEGERIRVERVGGPKKRKRPAKGQSAREKATAERAAQIAARQAAEEAKVQAEKQRLQEEQAARERAAEKERAEREEQERLQKERERQEAIAEAAKTAAAIVAASRSATVDVDDYDSSEDERSTSVLASETQASKSAADTSITADDVKRKRVRPSAEVLARRAAMRREQRAAKKAAEAAAAAAASANGTTSHADAESPTRLGSPMASMPTTPAPHLALEVDSPTATSTPVARSVAHSDDEAPRTASATAASGSSAKRVAKPQTEEQKAAARRRREKYRLNKLAQKKAPDDPAQARVLAKAILNPAIDTSRITITPALQQAIDALKAEQAATNGGGTPNGNTPLGIDASPAGNITQSPSGRSMSVNALIS